jgi:hemolysin activation/secretion protein
VRSGKRATIGLLLAAVLLTAPFPSVQAQSAGSEIRFQVKAFQVEGDNPLSEEQTQAILGNYLGEHVGIEGLQAAADDLEAALQKQGHNFLRVVLPPQKIAGGVIRLQVIAFRLGKVTVKGNRFFSEANILRSLPSLVPGEMPDTYALGRDLEFANTHGSKQVKMFLRESEESDDIDARLEVQDVDPLQVYLTASNTGSKSTGWWRTSFGLQHSNLWDRDHSLSFSFTTSPDHVAEVKQYGAYYRVPLYGRHVTLTGYATYSDVDSGTIAETFEVSGRGRFRGLAMDWTLPRQGNLRHNLTLSVDDKFFDNDVAFLGQPIGVDIRSRPISLKYALSYDRPEYTLALGVTYARNLRHGEENDDTAYAASRTGATSDWEVWRYDGSLDYRPQSGWLARASFSGQATAEPLIAGEQFGLGGATNVRGFEEREIAGDQGLRTSLELWTPNITPNLRLLTFFDAGRYSRRNVQTGEIPADTIASLGAGLRWTWNNRLNLSLDFARVLQGAQDTREGDNKLHANLFWNFQ